MSEYVIVQQVSINDADALKETLVELGYPYEEYPEPKLIEGNFDNKQEHRAHIIIKQNNKFQFGFLRKPDHSWEMVRSSFFSRANGGWMETLEKKFSQIYAKRKLIKEINKRGWTIESKKTTSDGKLKIKVMV